MYGYGCGANLFGYGRYGPHAATDGPQPFGLSAATPADEPLTLAELKKHLKVDHDAEDDLIAAFGIAAREMTEAESRRPWVARAITLTLAHWPAAWAIELPTPAASLTGVAYYAVDGTLTTLANCQSWLAHSPPLVYPPANAYFWPGLLANKVAPVVVTYAAGCGTKRDVPESAKVAIRACVAHWYESRGDAKDPHELGMPPLAARLCQLLRTGDYP